MKELTSCPCCHSSSLGVQETMRLNRPEGDIRDILQKFSYVDVRKWILFERILKTKSPIIFKVMICNSCGFMFTNPRFTTEEIKIKYQTIAELGCEKNSPVFSRNLDKRALGIYKLVKRYFPQQVEHKKILDYGGSWGYNLHHFIGNNNAYILDYVKWDHYKDGIEYIGEDVADLKNNNLFDIILILHTLEHVIEPYLFLKKTINHLSFNGLIYIEVPLGVFREYSHIKEPITHLNFFSEESLVNLFRRLRLNVVHISTRNQWVTHSKSLCINIIGIRKKKRGLDKEINFKTAYYQMHNYFYYCPLILNKLRSKLKLQ